MIKTISKLLTEGNFLNQIEGIYKILKLTSYLTSERLNPSPSNWEKKKTRILLSLVLFVITLEDLGNPKQERKINKRYTDQKVRSKTSLFTDDTANVDNYLYRK